LCPVGCWRSLADTMRRFACVGVVGAALVLLSVSSAAAGDAPRVGIGLDYQRSNDAGMCPDKPLFRRLLLGAFGYDPIRPIDDPRLVVSLTKEGREVRAELSLYRAGSLVWHETRKAALAECQDLVDSLAVSSKIHLSPPHARRSTEAGSLPPGPPPANAALPAPSPMPTPMTVGNTGPSDRVEIPRPRAASKPWSGQVGVQSWAYYWGLPMPVAALGASLGVRWRFLSVTAEGRYYAPASDEVHRVEGGAASLVPCAHYWIAHGCFVGTGGLARVEGPELTRLGTLAFVGARAGVDVPAWGPLFVRVDAEVSRRLVPYLLGVNSTPHALPSPWTAGGGIGVLAHF